MRHDGTNKDGNEESRDGQNTSDDLDARQSSIEVQDHSDANPQEDLIGHKDLPPLDHQFRVE